LVWEKVYVVVSILFKTLFYFLFLSGVQIKPETRLTLPKLPAQGSEAPGRQQKMSSEEEVRLDGHQQLSSRTLCLPVCRISESVQQLMELAFNTQREAVGSSVQW
jgi:centromere/kinetochore protein ZW10